jgi:hypothetical protein
VLKDFVDEFKCNVERLFKELTKLLRIHAKGERTNSYNIRSFGMVDDSCPMFLLEDIMHLIVNLEGKIRRYDPQAQAYNEAKSLLLQTLTTHEVIIVPFLRFFFLLVTFVFKAILLVGALKSENSLPSRKLYNSYGDPNDSKDIFSAAIRYVFCSLQNSTTLTFIYF